MPWAVDVDTDERHELFRRIVLRLIAKFVRINPKFFIFKQIWFDEKDDN